MHHFSWIQSRAEKLNIDQHGRHSGGGSDNKKKMICGLEEHGSRRLEVDSLLSRIDLEGGKNESTPKDSTFVPFANNVTSSSSGNSSGVMPFKSQEQFGSLRGIPVPTPKMAPRSPCKRRRGTRMDMDDDMEDSYSESSTSSSQRELFPGSKAEWLLLGGGGDNANLLNSSRLLDTSMGLGPGDIPCCSMSPSPSSKDVSPMNSLDESRMSQNATLLRSPQRGPFHHPNEWKQPLLSSSPPIDVSSFTVLRSPLTRPRISVPSSPAAQSDNKSPICPTRLFQDDLSEEESTIATASDRKDYQHHHNNISTSLPNNISSYMNTSGSSNHSSSSFMAMTTPSSNLRRNVDSYLSQNPFRSPFAASMRGPNTIQSSNGRFHRDFVEATKIGSGSFGEVHKAIKRLDLCSYAIKIIPMRKSTRYYLKEVQALATQADNPFVVRYFDCWIEEDKLYILSELCEGTLQDRTTTGPQPDEAELCHIACHILLGLHSMHESNIAHLDIKPANIYLSRTGLFKIGDLGLVTPADSGFDAEDGDNRYLCAELLNGQLQDLRKADIFSLGATLYELARWASLPQTGEEYHAIRQGTISLPTASFSPAFIQALKDMMHPNADLRPSCAQLLASPLFNPQTNLKSTLPTSILDATPTAQCVSKLLSEEKLDKIKICEQNEILRDQLERTFEENRSLKTELEDLKQQLMSVTLPSKNRRLQF